MEESVNEHSSMHLAAEVGIIATFQPGASSIPSLTSLRPTLTT